MLYTDDELLGTDGATRARLIERLRESSQIIYVANTTARAQLVTDIASWFTPSSTNPLYVYRGSAPDHAKVEVTTNGSTWVPLNVGADSGWTVPASWGTNFSANSTFRSRLIGPRVRLKGLLQRTTDLTAGTTTGATLAAGHRPPETIRVPCVQWVNGGTPTMRAKAALEITAAGVVTIHCEETTTGVFVDGVEFLTD